MSVRARSISATVATALSLSIIAADTAQAGLPQFWPPLGSWFGNPSWPRQRHRSAKPRVPKKDLVREPTNGPLQIVVSIADQRISVYDNGALLARSVVSTGVEDHPTPLGVFGVIGKQRWHRSNLYSNAPMPYMQRITWSGVALHAGIVPGRPASHGCIRLKNDFAARLWRLTRRGDRVIIASHDTGPAEISNPRLFAARAMPAPELASGPPATAIADNYGTVTASVPAADARETDPAADAAAADATPAATPKKIVPVSVFVSRKAGRLYVRRGYAPLFDTAVTIRDPEQPLGTHVFTVLTAKTDGEPTRWTVVTMPDKSAAPVAAPEVPKRPHKRGKHVDTHIDTPPASPDQANAALDRIDIPTDAVERISDLLTPGSSLIVSDHGISRETGKGTDFIIVTE